jgi:glycosyltransferase involved in cell wall biosynthesis
MNFSFKVAWVTDHLDLGGTTTILLNYTRWLTQHGIQSAIYCFKRPDDFIAAEFSTPGVVLRPTPPGAKIYEDLLAEILKEIARQRPHALVAFNGERAYEVLRYAPRGLRRIAAVHADEPPSYDFVVKYAAWIDALVSDFRDLPLRLPPDLPLGKAISYCWLPGAIADPGFFERRWPYNRGKMSVLYIGRLDRRQKRVHLLPRIAKQVIDAGVPAHFDVVGSGPERACLQAEIQSLGLDGVFTLSPAKKPDEVRRCMQSHDVFLLPSAYEGLPLALIEALSCQMAAVVSDLPSGIWEIVDRQSAMIVPIDGPEGYAEAIIRLWREPNLGCRLGERAREVFLEGFSLEVLGPKWFQVLGVEKGKSPPEVAWPEKIALRQPLFLHSPLHHPALRPLRRPLAAFRRGNRKQPR